MYPIPAATNIAPSSLDSCPPMSASIIGRSTVAASHKSRLISELLTLTGCPARPTKPRTSVKSATLLPSNVPAPIVGTPSSAARTAINVSGRADITATSMNAVKNSVKCITRESFPTERTAYCAAFISTKLQIMNIAASFSIILITLVLFIRFIEKTNIGYPISLYICPHSFVL